MRTRLAAVLIAAVAFSQPAAQTYVYRHTLDNGLRAVIVRDRAGCVCRGCARTGAEVSLP